MDSLIHQLNIGIQMFAIGIVVWFAFWRGLFSLYMIAAGGLTVVGAIAVAVLYRWSRLRMVALFFSFRQYSATMMLAIW